MVDEAKIDGRTREAKALRPPLRSDDLRHDAAERARQIMENLGDFGGEADEFYVPEGVLPDGYVGEWKTYSVMGAVDPSKQVELARTGWEPVPTSYWPEGMPAGTKELNITKKGMQFMMRPKEVSDFIKKRDAKAARDQMRSKKEQLEGGASAGASDQTNKGTPLSKVKSGFRPLDIPD